MDERKQSGHEWDDSVYGTGSTQPPKSRGGLIALLLILIIFLCGVITVMGVLNVKLFQKLQMQEESGLSICFTAGATQPMEFPPFPETMPPVAVIPEATEIHPRDTLDLHQAPEGIANLPEGRGMSLQDIYTKTIPSVVSITASNPGGTNSGTGVVLTQEGHIVTNAHVISGALSISVQLTDGRILTAEILGLDEASDLAVLVVKAKDLVPAQFGDSASLRVGDTVVAIGDPLGVEFRGTYTNGIVSAINRDVEVNGHPMTLIQTNAALNTGNSGGPLINCYGQVIGINTMKIGAMTGAAGVEGLGFAIPSATVKTVVDQLISQGYVSGRPTLGITGEGLTPFYQSYYHWPAGLYITQVTPGSDACQKGVEAGDILIRIGEQPIASMEDLTAALRDRAIGETVTVVIFRSGEQYEIPLELEEEKG